MGFSDGEPVPVPPQSSVFPFALPARPPSGESVPPFVPSRRQRPPSPPGRPTTVPSSRFRVRGPNHALQRTEAGVRVFPVYHVLLRQPLSLSLSPLGQQSFPAGASRASRSPFPSLQESSPFRLRASTRAFPLGSLRLPVHPFGASPASFSPSRRQRPSFPRRSGSLSFRRSRGPL